MPIVGTGQPVADRRQQRLGGEHVRDLAQGLLEAGLQVVPKSVSTAADIAPGIGKSLVDAVNRAFGHLAPQGGLAAVQLVFLTKLRQRFLVNRSFAGAQVYRGVECVLLLGVIVQELDLGAEAVNDTVY